MSRAIALFVYLLLATVRVGLAEDAVASSNGVSAEQIRNAIDRAIPTLEIGATVSADSRSCFTCHNQGVVVFALAEARKKGVQIHQNVFDRQLKHTWDHLNRGRKGYEEGRGQGGKIMTAGYGLWTLKEGKIPSDELTTAIVNYLIDEQSERVFWKANGRRPPSSGSEWTATFVAVNAIHHYGTANQLQRFAPRASRVLEWALATRPKETEDVVFRLRLLTALNAEQNELEQAVQELLGRQQPDGGWSQKNGMKSDAYATATAITTLLEDGGIDPSHTAIRQGIAFLVNSQLDDGTWYVKSRAVPFQDYYESGFPHDEDQFISITASAWAVVALLQTLPVTEPEEKTR